MDIPQKDIVEMNSHVFKINRGKNIVKALFEGNILTIYVMHGIIQMNSDLFNEAALYILSDEKVAVRLFVRFLKKYFPEFAKISSSKDIDGTIYVNTKFKLKTSFQFNRENNGNHVHNNIDTAHFIIGNDSSKTFDMIFINFRGCDFTALAWNLFKEDPVDVIRYARIFPYKTERTNKRLKQMYDSLSPSEKLEVELDLQKGYVMNITSEEKEFLIKALGGGIYDPSIESVFNGNFAGVEIKSRKIFFEFKEDRVIIAEFSYANVDMIRRIILKIPNADPVYSNVENGHYIICDSSYGWRIIQIFSSSNYLGLGHYGHDGKLERYFGTISFRRFTVLSEYGWKLLRESPITTIRYTRECDQKLYDADDNFKKKINEIYNEMTDSDKLLLELGCD